MSKLDSTLFTRIIKEKYGLLLWPLYYLYIVIKTSINGNFYDESFSDIIQIQILLTAAMGLIWIASQYSLRGSNYQGKIILPALLLVDLAAAIGSIFDESLILKAMSEPEVYTGTGLVSTFIIVGFLELFIIPTILGYFIFKYMLGLLDPFMKVFEKRISKIEEGDYESNIEDPYFLEDNMFGPLANFVNRITGQVSELLISVTDNNKIISNSSEQLSANSFEIQASVEDVASTSQIMSEGATQQAQMIEEIMENLEMANSTINDIIMKINMNTQSVSQISLQTNILALNAGIEASRAGDYGRGFAVVAENVRKLSDESKIASDEIAEVVTIISNTLISLFSVLQEKVAKIAMISETTAASAEEVAATTQEINNSMESLVYLSTELSNRSENSKDLIEKKIEVTN